MWGEVEGKNPAWPPLLKNIKGRSMVGSRKRRARNVTDRSIIPRGRKAHYTKMAESDPESRILKPAASSFLRIAEFKPSEITSSHQNRQMDQEQLLPPTAQERRP